MACEHTSSKVVDHCDRLEWGAVLPGLTVEDSNIVQITEISGLHLAVSGFGHFKIRLLGKFEDLVVSLDNQLNLVRASLSIDTRDREVIDASGLCCGDHRQVDHSI